MSLTDHALSKEATLCVITDKDTAFVEFRSNAQTRHGFASSQLLHYKLEANAGSRTADGPPQRLALAFSNAEVILTGWRLEHVANEVRDGRLAIVRTLPDATRHEHLDPNKPAIATIEVNPLGKVSTALRKPTTKHAKQRDALRLRPLVCVVFIANHRTHGANPV